jgi:hypothetical protein
MLSKFAGEVESWLCMINSEEETSIEEFQKLFQDRFIFEEDLHLTLQRIMKIRYTGSSKDYITGF